MIVAAKKKTVEQHLSKPLGAPPGVTIIPWDDLSEPDPESGTGPQRGKDAVPHTGTRGRRSEQFPDLNITETAKRLSITKSHLAKILSGRNRPSLVLARKLADVLGTSVEFVVMLGDNRNTPPQGGKTKQKRK